MKTPTIAPSRPRRGDVPDPRGAVRGGSVYRFAVGSCRLGAGFADPAVCGARIRPVALIEDAVPR
ncbi:MAG: hypothetical protein AcusKO_43930 [Acuticoccus sp.]